MFLNSYRKVIMQEKKYGLFTSVTMITGIVIGSGIFFKSDDVLTYSSGSMLLGIIVFLVAAASIIFGSLAVSNLASRSDRPGGIISYAEEFVNVHCASALGWFQTFLYLASLIAVVAWVSGLYICQLFGINASNKSSNLIGLIVLCMIYLMNVLSAVLGGMFQNAAMIVKLIPLVAIAGFGIINGEPIAIIRQEMTGIRQTFSNVSIFAAFAPIAFSYDGWIVATSVCHKIKNSKRNLPLAMVLSPLIILVCYITYFVGITSLLGVNTVLEAGNNSVFLAASKMFGSVGAKLILIFVVVSVLGTLNGLILAFIQMPYSLAIRNMIPWSDKLSKKSEKLDGMPFASAVLGFIIALFWMLMNYFMLEAGLPGDVSEVPVCISYANVIILYIAVIRLAKKKEIKSKIMGYVVPVLAIVGSLIILAGGLSHPFFLAYVLLSLVIMGGGYWYSKRMSENCNKMNEVIIRDEE